METTAYGVIRLGSGSIPRAFCTAYNGKISLFKILLSDFKLLSKHYILRCVFGWIRIAAGLCSGSANLGLSFALTFAGVSGVRANLQANEKFNPRYAWLTICAFLWIPSDRRMETHAWSRIIR